MESTIIVKRTGRSINFQFRKYWQWYVMVLPGVAFFILFKYIPLFGSVIAFQDYSIYKGIWHSTWVGLENFHKLFQYPDFRRVFLNTLILGMLRLIFTFPLPIILAIMLTEVRNRFYKSSIQAFLYIPHFLSAAIVGGLVFDFLGYSGIFNNLRASLGLEPVLIMQQAKHFRTVFILSTIWKETGWGTVVYMAALSTINPSILESAMIDGAGKLRTIFQIKFPLLLPTIITLFLLNMGSFLDLGFEAVYNLLTPMTLSTGDIFDTYVFRVGIQGAQYSYTTAIGVFQSIIAFVLVVVFNKIANKSSDGGLW